MPADDPLVSANCPVAHEDSSDSFQQEMGSVCDQLLEGLDPNEVHVPQTTADPQERAQMRSQTAVTGSRCRFRAMPAGFASWAHLPRSSRAYSGSACCRGPARAWSQPAPSSEKPTDGASWLGRTARDDLQRLVAGTGSNIVSDTVMHGQGRMMLQMVCRGMIIMARRARDAPVYSKQISSKSKLERKGGQSW